MSAIARAAFGRAPDVRFYSGTPEQNSSGVAFPEAIEVWAGRGCTWSETLDSIPVDPSATRFDRQLDAIPLRPEQMASSIESLDRLLSLRDRRIVDWTFMSAEEVPVAPEPLEDHEACFVRAVEAGCGKRTQKLLPLLLGYFRAHDPQGEWSHERVETTCFRHGGTRVVVGRPSVDAAQLDACSCAEIAVVPHSSRRGPNGIWLIARGAEHPFVRELSCSQAYYLEESRRPDYVLEMNGHWRANGIELFTTHARARAAAQQSELAGAPSLRVVQGSGTVLERVIARADVVDVDLTHRFALTHQGLALTGASTLATPSELLAALKPRRS